MTSLDFTAARDDFEKAVALNPKLPEANASLGLALLGLSQADAAADAFRRELALDPNNFAAALQSGILAKQNQNSRGAPVSAAGTGARPEGGRPVPAGDGRNRRGPKKAATSSA
jgi:tetratricopeptide (TPR) repeat protein